MTAPKPLSSPSKWDERFLTLASVVAQWSKDPSTKVGAVIADGKHVVSLGFNGFPPQIDDNPEWLKDRNEKYPRVIHAEVNAILNAHRSVRRCTLYTVPLSPCPDCAKFIVASGITRVVSKFDPGLSRSPNMAVAIPEWTGRLFQEAGIEFEVYE